IGGANVDGEREIRELFWSKRQIWDNALERALQIKQVEAAPSLRSPIRCALDISPQQNSYVPFFFSRWRSECTTDLEDGNALGSGTNVSFEHVEQTADQVWPQRNVIFA